MPKLPTSVRIAAFDIRIEEMSVAVANDARTFGDFSPRRSLIRIEQEGRPRAHVLDTLLHEITHAIWWSYNIQDDDKEERTVTIMATAWVQIYRDNPDLLAFICASVAPPGETYDVIRPRRDA